MRLPAWGDAWRILLLLHGEDDLERFREELPVAVYRLPWLIPGESGELPATEEERRESTYQAELQDLGKLLQELPALDDAS